MTRSALVDGARLQRYIEKRVLPGMNAAGGVFALQPTGLGNRNIVFYLDIKSMPGAVLKGYRKKRRAGNALIANRFLSRCGVNVPGVLFADQTRRTYKQLGWYFVCEERIAGKNLFEIDNITEAIGAVGEFYAGLHSLRSSRWGRFTSGRKYGFGRSLLEKAARRLDALEKSGAFRAGPDAARCLDWLEHRLPTIRAVRDFSLCHGDVNRKNILMTEDRRVFAIDNEAIKYLPFPLEFHRLKIILCEDDPEAGALFEKSYFGSLPQKRYDEFMVCSEFYEAYVLLELAWYYNRKLNKSAPGDSRGSFLEEMRARSVEALVKRLGL